MSATYIKYMVPGIALLIVFAVVIPGFWFLILWYNRKQLDVSAGFVVVFNTHTRTRARAHSHAHVLAHAHAHTHAHAPAVRA